MSGYERVMGSVKRTTDATLEPVTRAQAKLHCRIDDDTPDDTLVDDLIARATAKVESDLRRQLVQATYTLKLDAFPDYGLCHYWDAEGSIRPPMPPLAAVSSITYVDTDGATATLATTVYGADTNVEPGRIHLLYNQTWPSTRDVKNAVTVVYTAGFSTTASGVPQEYKGPILMLVGHWYEDGRQAASAGTPGSMTREVPLGYNDLIYSLRVMEVA